MKIQRRNFELPPWIIKYCETAISGSSMSCSSKEPNVHAITRQNRRWHHSLWPSSTTNSQKKLILFVPNDGDQKRSR